MVDLMLNMMELEDNQLDFNQPLLTVRRFSSTVVPRDNRKINRTTANLPLIPTYKSDLKSGPVRNPGTVPFIWEQSPGRPKDEGKSLNPTLNARVIPPKPPPGKNPKQPDSNQVNQEVEADREKNCVHKDGSSVTCERVDDAVEEKADSGSEIDDEAFSDAMETFSRSESRCLSCRVSGLSGVDGLDSRLSRRFSKEPPARDFMMGRFLPAAKAMASEAPANFFRKPQFKKDPPRHTNAINEGRCTQLYQYKLNARFVNDRYVFGEASEDDFDECKNPSAKMCGLLPQLCLSNAVSSVGVHTARSTYPLRQFQVKSSYKRRQRETWCCDGGFVNMRKSAGNFSNVEQYADKSEPKAISSYPIYPISERDGKILEPTSLYKLMESREMAKRPDSSSQTKRVWADISFKDIAVVENSVTLEPCKPPERRGMNFRQLLASEGSKWESELKVPIFEKAVYADAVQMVESRDLDVSTSDSRGVNESAANESDEKKKNVTSKSADDDASVRLSLAEMTSLDITQKSATSWAGTVCSTVSSPASASEGAVSEITVKVVNGSKHEESSSKLPEAGTTLIDDGKNSPETSSVIDGKIDLEGDINSKLGDPLVIPGIYADFPISPPLPKSPSDSWLLRTLPSMWSKNSGQCPSFAANVFSKVHPTPKPAPIDPKLETIVKTSNVDRGHLRFLEELLAPIPESCAVEH